VIFVSIAGGVLGCVIVVAAGQMGPVVGATRLTSWLGLVAPIRPDPGITQIPSLVMLPAMAALVALWCVTIRFVAARLSLRQAAVVCSAWAAPFALGPPLFSNDVYSYVAQGVMSANGIDPYAHGARSIAGTAAYSAVDPIWREVHSPYGPVATLMARFSYDISGGSAVGSLIVLRIVAALALVVIAAGVVALSARPRRSQILLIVGASPLLLFQVLSAVHLEGIMVALIIVALVLARRHPMIAIAVSSVAAGVKAPALVLTVILMISVVRQEAYLYRARAISLAALSALLPWVALAAVVPNSFGWVAGLRTPGLSFTPLAPTSIAAGLIASFRPDGSLGIPSLATSIGRLLGTAVALAVVVLVLVRLRHVRIPIVTGWCLLAVGVTGPVLYPWYLIWGLVPLAASHSRRRTEMVEALSVIGALMSVFGVSATVGGVFGLTVTAAYLAWLLWAPAPVDVTDAAGVRVVHMIDVDDAAGGHELDSARRSAERMISRVTPVADEEIKCAIEWGSSRDAVPQLIHAVDTSGDGAVFLHDVHDGGVERSEVAWNAASSLGKRCSHCATIVTTRSRSAERVQLLSM
jgi:hypothetical protein